MSERDQYIPSVPCWVDSSYKHLESLMPCTLGQWFSIATATGYAAGSAMIALGSYR
jgi:hypothetical protein